MSKNLEVQIAGDDFPDGAKRSLRTVMASVMIADCEFEVKVGRHKGVVEERMWAASIRRLCELRGVFGLVA